MNRRIMLSVLLPLLALALQWALWPWLQPFVRKPGDFAEFAEAVARFDVYWLTTNERR